ncbi:MAG: NADH-quinone oxidoreductase subunit C [Chloroflexi bacterium]|nr:NADH-quinone oxidoreductase subunit C [Chloroflexota bacterium]MDA8188340.1 NADH-quinone oxidoreductase subunit C [Dehalococcoidales bacterium]
MTAIRSLVSPRLDVKSLPQAISESIVRVVESDPPMIYVIPDRLVEVCRSLKETVGLEFDYLIDVTSADYLDQLEVVYHLHSVPRGHALTLKVELDREEASVPSVTGIWRGADFQEREVYDLMGITFTGHPNLKRILLYDEFVGHPLRKDFALPKEDISSQIG